MIPTHASVAHGDPSERTQHRPAAPQPSPSKATISLGTRYCLSPALPSKLGNLIFIHSGDIYRVLAVHQTLIFWAQGNGSISLGGDLA